MARPALLLGLSPSPLRGRRRKLQRSTQRSCLSNLALIDQSHVQIMPTKKKPRCFQRGFTVWRARHDDSRNTLTLRAIAAIAAMLSLANARSSNVASIDTSHVRIQPKYNLINKKGPPNGEPFLFIWRARHDSNVRPPGS